MIEAATDLSPESLALYSAIIDVRTPAEFAEDRLPGAINLPVLSTAERAEVGTIYVQESRFRARRMGAAYVARNVAHHLETSLATRDAKFRPLLYCWRGGMRSNSMATILSQIGWRVGVLDGGYRSWRRAAVAELSNSATPLRVILLDGETGAAKTDILRRLIARGVQAIDLEGLAAHKGSVFGAEPDSEQPPQKLFESALFDALRKLDQSRPIILEAESSRIGRLNLPARLWSAMRAAPRIHIAAPAPMRAAYLCRAYRDFIAAPGAISSALDRLRPFHAKEKIADWKLMSDAGAHERLALSLMLDHYDPLYERARRKGGAALGEIVMDNLDADGLEKAADRIEAIAKN